MTHISQTDSQLSPFNEETMENAIHMVRKSFNREILMLPLKELHVENVTLKMKESDIWDLVDARKVAIIFIHGKKRFRISRIKYKNVVYHGGLLPVETIVPFGVFKSK